MRRTNMYITIAVIIAAIGEFLIEHEIFDMGVIKSTMDGVWETEVRKRNPPVSSVGNQVMVLNLDSGIIRYGLLAWVLVYGAVCVGEGRVF